MNSDFREIEKIIINYTQAARAELAARWKAWGIDLSKPEVNEVVGALLARQVTLATQLAGSPGIWNGHAAPILLRSMADVHITLAWILKDPLARSRQFILYGLGQAKLMLEHRKNQLAEDGKVVEDDPAIEASEAWINGQRFTFLTEVDIGSWSGLTVREMAEEAGCLDFYRYSYTPFSEAVHSMWQHVSRFNLQTCKNPLHRYHNTPVDPDLDLDPHYLCLAAKYAQKSFSLFDETFSVQTVAPSAFDALNEAVEELGASRPQSDS